MSHSWSTEFQKRRRIFDEESNSGMEDEEGATMATATTATATMEATTSGVGGKSKKPSDEGIRNRRDSGKRRESEVEERSRKTHSPVASGGRSTPTRSTSVATPTSPRPLNTPTSPLQTGASWSGSNLLEQSTPQGSPRSSIDSTRSSLEISLGQRDFLDGQHGSFEDQLAPLGLSPSTTNRRSQSSRRVFTAETGQKERDISYGERVTVYGETTSPAFSSQSQSDDSEREDNALPAQIALLATRNQQLQQLLQDREQERDRLREQLETQRQDRLPRMPSSLPSKLLDGRFLRDPPPLRETVGTRTEEPPVQNQVSAVEECSRSPLVARAGESQSQIRDYLHQIETLQRSNAELERSFHEVSEEKRRLESELTHQRETLSKIQEREQDLSKDIETLRNENSYHASAVNKLTTEREGFQLENTTLHDEVTAVTEKLTKTEKCYKEVEHENLGLEADLDQLVKDKEQLFEEKQKLQAAVEDALKTKENYRSTIRQLREENMGLQGQLSESAGERNAAAGKAEKSTTRKVFGPLSKEQQTLSEVMSLREERSELKEKLDSAQLEIDALEAHLKAQETQEQSTNQIRGVVSTHLSQFQVELLEVAGGLESTRSAVCSLATQQEAVVKEGFSILAQKCREQLSVAEKDRTQLTSALKLSQASLSTMEEEYEKLRSENLKLLSKRSSVSAEVSTLRSEVASLRDQKKLLEVQLSQNESIFQQKDEKVRGLEAKQKTLQDKLVTVERVWKNEFDRLDHKWQDRLAEANLIEENLSEERESLLQEKAELEERLDRLQLENEEHEVSKAELQSHTDSLEGKMADLASRISQNDGDISVARRSIARLLAEKSCIAARMVLEQESCESVVSKSRQLQSQLDAATSEKRVLSESLVSSREEGSQLREKLEQISQKATQIDQLTSEVTELTSRNEEMETEIRTLTEKHTSAMQDLQQLAETEQSHLLDNQMIKMTLTTDIGLLKTKLKTVEEDKQALEEKVAELTSLAEKGSHQPVGGASAFQIVSESKQVEVLKKQIAALQQDAKQHQKSHVGDFQGRISALDAENKRLKEAVRGGSKEAQEASASLRKQMSEMSQKTFFLESAKKNLTDKVMTLQASLKVARELKDRAASERVQKMEKENLALQERLRALEETHAKKLMVADHKIVETVKENDKLRQKLLQIHSGVASDQKDGQVSLSHSLEELSKSLRTETAAVHSLRTGLTGSREELQQLELAHQRVLTLQTELQSLLPTQASLEASSRPLGISRTSSIGSALPPVLNTLPPEYVSRLQGSPSRPKSPPYGVHPASELRDKLLQLRGASLSLSECLKQHQRVLEVKEAELSSLHERFAAMEGRLEQAVRREAEIQECVASVQEFELRPEQLQAIAVLRKQVEFLQDQVIDRDMALQDIELQMRKDYESHDRKFDQLKSQVLELREQLSAKDDEIRTRDQYLQQVEERSLDMDEQLFKSRKELERMLQEREQLVAQGLPENIQLSGLNIAEVIRGQGEEVRQLKKVLNELSFEMTQLQSQLDSVQREKSVLQSKAIEMEKMHVQMKEAMNADINYLRRLNLQLVEQQMKAEKAVEVLHQVKETQETFKEQRERMRLEAELDSCKVKLHEQERKISDLDHQVMNQHITIKMMQAEKEHGLMMSQHSQERPPYMHRPHSAESARKPNYRISESSKLLRGGVGGRNTIMHQENEPFTIPLPAQNSSLGARVDILNLEEQPERRQQKVTLSLGPMVVTDDEASYSAVHESGEKSSKSHQRVQKLRSRGHRRTASTGSNIVVFPMEPTAPVSSNQPAPHSHTSKQPLKPIPKYPRRPGSAGSTRPDVRQITGIESPEHVAETAQEVTKQMTKLINGSASDDTPAIETPEGKGDSNPKLSLGQRGSRTSQGVPVHVHVSQSGQSTKTKHKYSEITRSKQASKSMDSNEATNSEGTNGSSGSSKSSSLSDGANKLSAGSIATSTQSLSLTGETPEGESIPQKILPRLDKAKDLSRTESMSSTTSSTLSIFGPGCTRNPSFHYDGGESSPYSHESLEIGDSIENLQALGMGKLGYSPYILPIPHKHDTTSSSEEDTVKERDHRFGRRKRSLGTAIEGSHETPHHKSVDDNSNSSCDSDQLQQASGFRGNGKASQPAIPVQRNESISISDIEKYSTDHEVEEKAVALQKCFRRVRYSSTGSVKICYSDSNTSLEDISKQL